jgi:kynurenine formamidase
VPDWGPRDRRGALNFITADVVAAACRDVRLGRSVSQFEDLVPLCEAADRWSFLCVVAPLRIPGGTGSPVNPIAVV